MSAQPAAAQPVAVDQAPSRQAFLVKPRELVLRDFAPPHPGPGAVLIQVKCALSCGTDLKAFRRGHPMWPMPTPFGHEFSGIVVETGEGVDNFMVGDAIMALPALRSVRVRFPEAHIAIVAERARAAYAETLDAEIKRDPAKLEQALNTFRDRMKHYRQERVYPTLPDWPVVCFYNMSKRRGEQRNWYALPYAERHKLMKGHAIVGRQYAGKVKQLITGSTGLDDAEWGVTLFARDTFQIKAIVYEMRFDPVSAEYADFGEFFIGIQLPLDELFRRLQL